ncbi:hypothetical protein M5053_11090, partial [Neisseria meningitidis]|nr:hypothetical protein [Neisseria meningitidis]
EYGSKDRASRNRLYDWNIRNNAIRNAKLVSDDNARIKPEPLFAADDDTCQSDKMPFIRYTRFPRNRKYSGLTKIRKRRRSRRQYG